jgi:hypothetical protein
MLIIHKHFSLISAKVVSWGANGGGLWQGCTFRINTKGDRLIQRSIRRGCVGIGLLQEIKRLGETLAATADNW